MEGVGVQVKPKELVQGPLGTVVVLEMIGLVVKVGDPVKVGEMVTVLVLVGVPGSGTAVCE